MWFTHCSLTSSVKVTITKVVFCKLQLVICSDPNDASSIYITDATGGKVYRLKLHCPAVVIKETKKMKSPIACTFACNLLLVCDNVDRKISVIDIRNEMKIRPNTLQKLSLQVLKKFADDNGINVLSRKEKRVLKMTTFNAYKDF